MRASRTHFEQIPLEVVKKLAEDGVASEAKISTDDVVRERISRKLKSRTAPARPLEHKRR